MQAICPGCAAVMKAQGILAIRGEAVKHLLKQMSHDAMMAKCRDAKDPEACLKQLMADYGMAAKAARPTASVDGEAHPAEDFAYVPDPEMPSTWKFPIFDAAHARNALARFNQADLPAADKAKVHAKIVAAAQRFNIQVSEDSAKLMKVDEAQRMVFGWANVAMMDETSPVIDLQDETIDGPILEKAAYDYVRRYRVVNDMHSGNAVGDLVEAFVATPEKLKAMGLKRDGAPAVGMWVGFKLDESQWQRYKKGERPMFSIEGEARHA